MSFLGSINPGSQTVFERCDQLSFVCVPHSFNSTSFCGLTHFCRHESCESFVHNHCYENPVCSDGSNISMNKRENATIWESKISECYDFQCNNDTGPVYLRKCNIIEQVCNNGTCYYVEPNSDNEGFVVEIEVEGIDAIDLNITEIRNEISTLANIEADSFRIRVYVDENDQVSSILIIVNDEPTAKNIQQEIDELSPEERQGILRHFKSARVVVSEREIQLSRGKVVEGMSFIIMIAFIALLFTF